MEFYPVLPAEAIPGAGDGDGTPPGIVAVRPGDLRRPGWGAVSALVAGTAAGRPVTRGEPLVFCHQVAVAPAVVRRSGEVQAGGWLPDHVTLGLLEPHLPAGEIGELIEDFGCAEERRRLLPAALAVRLVLAMTLVPDADVPEVICRAAGLLEHLPWARPWHVPGTEALARRRDKIPAELFEALFWQVAGPVADPGGPGMRWQGAAAVRPGRVPDPGPGHRRKPRLFRLLRHCGQLRAVPAGPGRGDHRRRDEGRARAGVRPVIRR